MPAILNRLEDAIKFFGIECRCVNGINSNSFHIAIMLLAKLQEIDGQKIILHFQPSVDVLVPVLGFSYFGWQSSVCK